MHEPYTVVGLLRGLIRDRRGQAAILIALLIAVLLAFVSLGVEVVLGLRKQREMQSAADSSALAAATAKLLGNSAWQWEGYSVVANAGFREGAPGPCATSNATVYIGTPCDGPHAGNDHFIEALVVQPFPLMLAAVVNYEEAFMLKGRAVASIEHVRPCALILDPTGAKAFRGRKTITESEFSISGI
jgi:surface antigen